MTGTITGFLVAMGATLAVCYALMTRRWNRRAAGRPSRGRSDGDGSSSTDDGGHMLVGGLATHHSAVDGCGNPTEFGSCDSGDSGSGGGDSGGGDSGGGSD